MSIKFYVLKEKYIDYLRKADTRVQKNKKEGRPYIGIVYKIEGFDYFSPLSSPKDKHMRMKSRIDFIKIDNGNLGIINLNNSVPVNKDQLKLLDINSLKNSLKVEEKKYGTLCEDQLIWCNDNLERIEKNFKKLYTLSINGKLPESIRDRCCDFKVLEKQCLDYSNKLKQEKLETIKNIIKSNSKNQYNCLTGAQIQIPERENGDNRWISSSSIEKEAIRLKERIEPTEGILCGKDADGSLKLKIGKYYNVSDVIMTEALEQKLLPMKEVTQEKEVIRNKEKDIEIER
ncbi:type III toxin-antitoxin system ToxN/AbiQ family toxin [Fusobacterium necrophorum]|uniref:type III toxin-antitoxin system ToxN/AbiQ family toxin n=1 Tax=Fusobacterium necrophorum TaxID=859 RepID=UPI000A544C47|nr:type III toxin-antitoxin system ToxN/AbiQ family toxin [Fusobacterium necrophorum]